MNDSHKKTVSLTTPAKQAREKTPLSDLYAAADLGHGILYMFREADPVPGNNA